MPFWKLQVAVGTEEVSRQQHSVLVALGDIDTLWITGFSTQRPDLHGDLGLILSERRIAVRRAAAPPPGKRVVGLCRSPQEAIRYGDIFIMTMVDKRTDVTGMAFKLRVSNIELWALPFADRGNTVWSAIGDLTLPAVVISDLAEIRLMRDAG